MAIFARRELRSPRYSRDLYTKFSPRDLVSEAFFCVSRIDCSTICPHSVYWGQTPDRSTGGNSHQEKLSPTKLD